MPPLETLRTGVVDRGVAGGATGGDGQAAAVLSSRTLLAEWPLMEKLPRALVPVTVASVLAFSAPPLAIVVFSALPPEKTICMAPLATAAVGKRARGDQLGAAAADRAVLGHAAGDDYLLAAAVDHRAAAESAVVEVLDAAAIDRGADRPASRVDALLVIGLPRADHREEIRGGARHVVAGPGRVGEGAPCRRRPPAREPAAGAVAVVALRLRALRVISEATTQVFLSRLQTTR